MTITSGTVIDRISRYGDVGEPGYSCWGQELRECTYSGSKDDWHGATQDALSSLLPTCYITESVYSYLTKAEIESVKSRILGIVPDLYAYRHRVSPSYGRSYRCWEFIDGIEARPLPGDTMTTRIPDGTTVCFYGELAEIGGYNGIDHLIVDRSDGGPNIWSSNFTVGSCDTPYDIPDDEIDDETDDGTDGDEYEPKSELATDLSAIFGDIDTKWIIIGVIALIILGILSG